MLEQAKPGSEFGYCRSCQSKFPVHKQMTGGLCPVCGWKYDETFTEEPDFRSLAGELAGALKWIRNDLAYRPPEQVDPRTNERLTEVATTALAKWEAAGGGKT